MEQEYDLTKIICNKCGHWVEVFTQDAESYSKPCEVCYKKDNVFRLQNTIKCADPKCLQVWKQSQPFLHDKDCGTIKKFDTKIALPWKDEKKFKRMADVDFYKGDKETESLIKSQKILRDRVDVEREKPRNDITQIKDSLAELVKIMKPKDEQVKTTKINHGAIL